MSNHIDVKIVETPTLHFVCLTPQSKVWMRDNCPDAHPIGSDGFKIDCGALKEIVSAAISDHIVFIMRGKQLVEDEGKFKLQRISI